MIAKLAIYLYVAVALQMTHCTRTDNPDTADPHVASWHMSNGQLCARLTQGDGVYTAKPRVDPAKPFATKQVAIDWIETNYCLVDKK